MEVLVTSKERITVGLDDAEIGYLAEACCELVKHPTSEGGTYMEDIGKLLGEFDMLYQLRKIANNQEAEQREAAR